VSAVIIEFRRYRALGTARGLLPQGPAATCEGLERHRGGDEQSGAERPPEFTFTELMNIALSAERWD
jgi:hypothetical protein